MDQRAALSEISKIAAEQGGFVTNRQARVFGVDGVGLDRLRRRGLLRRSRRGVYVFNVGRASSSHEDEVSAWLAVNAPSTPWESQEPDAVLSHSTAARLHGIGTILPDLPELTKATRDVVRRDLRIHTARISPEDWGWTTLDEVRVPVTTPARTIIDLLLSGAEDDYLIRAIRQAFNSRRQAEREVMAAARRRRIHSKKLVDNAKRLITEAWS